MYDVSCVISLSDLFATSQGPPTHAEVTFTTAGSKSGYGKSHIKGFWRWNKPALQPVVLPLLTQLVD
jgi:hypothetical protein|tara:strand:- start:373 stop:573 length:201 start_codon:yes stop_codon:yes gene_type:complete